MRTSKTSPFFIHYDVRDGDGWGQKNERRTRAVLWCASRAYVRWRDRSRVAKRCSERSSSNAKHSRPRLGCSCSFGSQEHTSAFRYSTDRAQARSSISTEQKRPPWSGGHVFVISGDGGYRTRVQREFFGCSTGVVRFEGSEGRGKANEIRTS